MTRTLVRIAMLSSLIVTTAALYADDPCRDPWVRFQISQVSIFPKASSPLRARLRAPGVWSRIHAILVAEK